MNDLNTLSQLTQILGISSQSGVSSLRGTSAGITGASGVSEGEFAQVTISRFGRQINDIYSKLKTIEDPTDRDAALQGMREMMLGVISNPTYSNLMGFVSTIDRVASADASTFQAIFSSDSSATKTEETTETEQPGRFEDTYGKVMASSLGSDFAKAGLNVIMNEGSSEAKKATFDAILNQTNTILNADLEAEDLLEVKNRFFDGLASKSTLAEKLDFANNFTIEPPETEEAAETQSTEG